MFATDQETVFRILDIGNMPTSGRQIQQELRTLPNGKIRRKLSGRGYSSARPQFNLFQTTVFLDDIRAPAFAGLWPGDIVTIHCAVELPQPQRIGTLPIRPVVEGTLRYLDDDLNDVDQAEAKWFTFCPVLECIVEPWAITDREWDAQAQSDITFVELAPAGYEEL